MNDPKIDKGSAKILLDTLCRVGNHIFVGTGVGGIGRIISFSRCTCNLYTWEEWQEVMNAKLP